MTYLCLSQTIQLQYKVAIFKNDSYLYTKSSLIISNSFLNHNYDFLMIEKREQLNAIREISHLTPTSVIYNNLGIRRYIRVQNNQVGRSRRKQNMNDSDR